MNKKPVSCIRAILLVGLTFISGWTASLWANGNGLNTGLITALNSVGKNLLGVTAYAVTEVVVDGGNGGIPAIRFDFVDQPPDPIRIGVFRGDTCDTYAQLEIESSGLRIVYDSEVAPGGSIDIVDLDLSTQPPDPCINGAVVSPG